MLSGVDRAVRADGAEHDRELMLGYVSAYVVTAKLLTKVGATDLAMLAADRAANKAMEADSLVARGMSAYQVACALLRADRSDDAEHLAVNMAEQLQAKARSDEPVVGSLSGAMWREARGQDTLAWITSHTFRKTAATILGEAALSARLVADQLGHSRPSMTQDVYLAGRAVDSQAAVALQAALRDIGAATESNAKTMAKDEGQDA